jgi:nitroreductase
MTGPVLLAEHQLKAYLGIEESRQVNMVIALGYPATQPGKLPRREVDEILRFVD